MSKLKKLKGEFKLHVHENDKDVLKGTFHNSTTDLLKGIELANGISSMVAPMTMTMSSYVLETSSSYFGYNNSLYNHGITMYLANLTEEEQNALSEHSLILPIYNADGTIKNEKIVGYATASRNPGAIAGTVVPALSEDYLNTYRTAVGFKWNEGSAVGSYNTILIGSNVMQSPGTGYSILKGVEQFNIPNSNDLGNYRGFYIRPGVDGITSAYEILVGDFDASSFADMTVARAKLNLKTGELTKLSETDNLYGLPLGKPGVSQVVADGYLFLVTREGLYYINTETKSSANLNGFNTEFGSLWYASSSHTLYSATSSRTSGKLTGYRYNTKNLAAGWISTFDINISNQSDLITSYGDNSFPIICNYGDKYIMVFNEDTSDYTKENNIFGIVFTEPDLENTPVKNSAVEFKPFYNLPAYYEIDGKLYGFGRPIRALNISTPLNSQNMKVNVKGANTEYTLNTLSNMLCVSKLHGNLLAYAFITDSSGSRTSIVNDGSNAFTYSYAWMYADSDSGV